MDSKRPKGRKRKGIVDMIRRDRTHGQMQRDV